MNMDEVQVGSVRAGEAELERHFIRQYLLRQGYSPAIVKVLPDELRKPLMAAASLFASSRLAEVEDRAHFVQGLHGATVR